MKTFFGSFGRIRFILFSLLLLLCMLCISCCGTPAIWGYSVEEFLSRLYSGNLPQLREHDTSGLSFAELDHLGPGAPLFLSYFPFADSETPLRLRLYQAKSGQEPYASFALEVLISELLEHEEYRRLQGLADELSPGYSDFYPLRRGLVSASYWLRQDANAEELLNELMQDFPGQTEGDGELVLLRTVLSQRTGREDWRDSFIAFFRDYLAGPYHVRAWDYLRIEDLLQQFDPDEQLFLRGVDLVARGETARGFVILKDLLSKDQSGGYISSVSLRTLSLSAKSSAETADLLDFFQSIAEGFPRFSRELQEISAFALRRTGRHREAHTLFSGLADNGEQRFLWYSFSSLVRSNTAAALKELPFLLAEMDDPSYFSDVLVEFCQRLALHRNWNGIARAYQILDGSVGAGILSPYAYISARTAAAGLSDIPLDLPPEDILERLGRDEYPGSGAVGAPQSSTDPYYRILSAAISGGDPESEPRLPESEADAGKLDPVLAGFLKYGLLQEALDLAYRADDQVSAAAASELVKALYKDERFEEGLRLLLRRDLSMEKSFLYPRAFQEYTESSAEEQRVPAWLLFALVRQESLFNPHAVSHAGAVGLTQLMPATAQDVAHRLGLKASGDLSVPESNLRFGAWYLRHMTERTDSFSDALAGYNAGITRLRRWRRQAGGLPDDLFVETLPFQETRDYIKKLLVSSWNYGYLYYRLSGEELVELFFPSL